MLTAFSKYVSGYLLPNKIDHQVNAQKCPSGSTESIISPPPIDFDAGPKERENEWVFVIDPDDKFDSGLSDDYDGSDHPIVQPLNRWEEALDDPRRCHGNEAVVPGTDQVTRCDDVVDDGYKKDPIDEGIHSPMILSLRDNLDLKFHDTWDRRDKKKAKSRTFNMALKAAARQQRTDKTLERLSVSSAGDDESNENSEAAIIGKFKRDRRGGKKKSHRAGKEIPKYQVDILEEGASAIESNMTKRGQLAEAGCRMRQAPSDKKQRWIRKTLSGIKNYKFDEENAMLDMVFQEGKENVIPKQRLSFFYKNKSGKRDGSVRSPPIVQSYKNDGRSHKVCSS